MKLFEDKDGTIFHNCPKTKIQSTPEKDHVLLTKTITRVSQLEQLVEELQKKLE